MPTIAPLQPETLGDFVGVWIRQTREEINLSQSQLADRIKRPQSMVSRWERGAGVPQVDEFVTLCRALRRDPADALARVLQLQLQHLPLFAGG